jgi:hypothetical protein
MSGSHRVVPLARSSSPAQKSHATPARVGSNAAQRRLEGKLEAWEAEHATLEAELAKLRAEAPFEASVEERADPQLQDDAAPRPGPDEARGFGR